MRKKRKTKKKVQDEERGVSETDSSEDGGPCGINQKPSPQKRKSLSKEWIQFNVSNPWNDPINMDRKLSKIYNFL